MILAWAGALAIGVSLGLLGSGGSILTVPILVYLVGEGEKTAIAESLAIVGAVALAGAVPYALRRLVAWRRVLLFGLPGMAGAYLGAQVAAWVPGKVQLTVFAAVMLAAAALMARPPRLAEEGARPARAGWKIAGDGLAVGVLTGLVGVGGGFLIVPALVLLGGLAMHEAVGTSLAIIALNSATGFAKHVSVLSGMGLAVDWRLIGIFVVLGAVGSVAGNAIGRRIQQARLRRIFGLFLVVMAGYILHRNLPALLR